MIKCEKGTRVSRYCMHIICNNQFTFKLTNPLQLIKKFRKYFLQIRNENVNETPYTILPNEY